MWGGYVLIDKGIVLWLHERFDHGLTDYKFYCFNGEPRFLYVSSGLDNHDNGRISFVDLNWEETPFRRTDYPCFQVLPEKPKAFDLMIKIARQLANGHPFLRVDLYEIDDNVKFSELTFSPQSGFATYDPKDTDLQLGDLLLLPIKE